MRQILLHPLTPLVLFAAGAAALYAACIARGYNLPRRADLVMSLGWLMMLAIWVDADARRVRRRPCYDFGFLVSLCLPLTVPWYCLWSRGRRGLLLLLGILGLYLVPWLAATAVWSIRWGGR